MDLLPVNLDGTVLFNVIDICTSHDIDCKSCTDIGGSLHNWLLSSNIKYVIIDFQDEKDICSAFIIEILQLRKRLKIPFLFTGLTSKPRKTFELYDYFSSKDAYVFSTPEEAVSFFTSNFLSFACEKSMLSSIRFNEPISIFRIKQSQKVDSDEDDAYEGEEEESDD